MPIFCYPFQCFFFCCEFAFVAFLSIAVFINFEMIINANPKLAELAIVSDGMTESEYLRKNTNKSCSIFLQDPTSSFLSVVVFINSEMIINMNLKLAELAIVSDGLIEPEYFRKNTNKSSSIFILDPASAVGYRYHFISARIVFDPYHEMRLPAMLNWQYMIR